MDHDGTHSYVFINACTLCNLLSTLNLKLELLTRIISLEEILERILLRLVLHQCSNLLSGRRKVKSLFDKACRLLLLIAVPPSGQEINCLLNATSFCCGSFKGYASVGIKSLNAISDRAGNGSLTSTVWDNHHGLLSKFTSSASHFIIVVHDLTSAHEFEGAPNLSQWIVTRSKELRGNHSKVFVEVTLLASAAFFSSSNSSKDVIDIIRRINHRHSVSMAHTILGTVNRGDGVARPESTEPLFFFSCEGAVLSLSFEGIPFRLEVCTPLLSGDSIKPRLWVQEHVSVQHSHAEGVPIVAGHSRGNRESTSNTVVAEEVHIDFVYSNAPIPCSGLVVVVENVICSKIFF